MRAEAVELRKAEGAEEGRGEARGRRCCGCGMQGVRKRCHLPSHVSEFPWLHKRCAQQGAVGREPEERGRGGWRQGQRQRLSSAVPGDAVGVGHNEGRILMKGERAGEQGLRQRQ